MGRDRRAGRRNILRANRGMQLTLANQITIGRILLILPFILCMLRTDEPGGMWFRYAALAVFLVMAGSDALDGYMARRRRQATLLGAFLDPLADKLLVTAACILLAVPETAVPGYRLGTWVVVLIVGKDLLLLTGFVLTYFVTGRLRIRTLAIGKLATVLQLTMVGSLLIGPEIQRILPIWPHLVRLLVGTTALVAVIVILVYIRGGIRYIEQVGDMSQAPSEHPAPIDSPDRPTGPTAPPKR